MPSRELRAKKDVDLRACLVTGCTSKIKESNLIGAATTENELYQLRWAWGELPMSEPGNGRDKLLLRNDYYRMFGDGEWLLLPSPEMVDLVYEHALESTYVDPPGAWDPTVADGRTKIESMYEQQEMFKYRLIPRLDFCDERILSNVTGFWAFHRFPFTKLAPLKSHAYPHFVILACARTLFELKFPIAEAINMAARVLDISFAKASDMIVKIMTTYTYWKMLPKPKNFGPPMKPTPTNGGNGLESFCDNPQGTRPSPELSKLEGPNHNSEMSGSDSSFSPKSDSRYDHRRHVQHDGRDFEGSPALAKDGSVSDEGASFSEGSASVGDGDEYRFEMNRYNKSNATVAGGGLDGKKRKASRVDLDHDASEKVRTALTSDMPSEANRDDTLLRATRDGMAHYVSSNQNASKRRKRS